MSSLPARRRRRPATFLAWALAAPWVWIAGCVYDADDRCSPGQVVIEHDRCACAPGFVAVDGVCQECPEHEFEENGACVCEEGYVRAVEGQPCVTEAPGLGDACSDDGDCELLPFTHCQADAAGDYCTAEDCSSDGCPSGFACDTEASPSYCKRPPLGQQTPCSSQEDCAGYEANYCETFGGGVCLVPGCDDESGDVTCFIGWECCHAGVDYGLPTLCVPEGSCPS